MPRGEFALTRDRTASRFWIYWIFLVGWGLAATGGCAGSAPPQPSPPPSPDHPAAQILSEAIRLRTVNPPGNEAPLAAYYVELLRAWGITAEVIETPSSEPGQRAAAWGIAKGRGRRAPVVLLSHLDVVPASGDGWEAPPFAGVVRDGEVIGRGALDAKGVSVVHLLAMRQIAEREQPLDRDVLFLAVPDEETGGAYGAGYVARAIPKALRGASYLLTEGGSVLRVGPGLPPVWGVGVTEKAPCWLQLVARGRPGHASLPRRDAAVPRLVAALEKVRLLEFPLRVVPAVAEMFQALAPVAAPEDAEGFRDLAHGLADAGFRERFLARPGYAALVKSTVSITVLRGGPRTNVVPAEASAQLDARLLPGDDCGEFTEQIREVIDDPGIEIETLLAFDSQTSPVTTPLFQAIERVAERVDPGAVVVPRVSAGFTDSHWFRDLGITAYGFVPRWHAPSELRGIHGENERISIENLERGVDVLVQILEELDAVENGAARRGR